MTESTSLNSFLSHFNSRVVATYFFYVLIWNWKLFGYLINVDLVPESEYIDHPEYNTVLDYIQSQFSIWYYLFIPAVCTLLSLWIMPQLNKWNANFRTLVRVDRENNDKRVIHGDLKHSTEDYKKLYQEHTSLEEKYRKSISTYEELQKEISNTADSEKHYRVQSEDRAKEIEKLKGELESARKNLEDTTSALRKIDGQVSGYKKATETAQKELLDANEKIKKEKIDISKYHKVVTELSRDFSVLGNKIKNAESLPEQGILRTEFIRDTREKVRNLFKDMTKDLSNKTLS